MSAGRTAMATAALAAAIMACHGVSRADEVGERLELVLEPSGISLFPLPGAPETFAIWARKTVDEPCELRLRVIIDDLSGTGSAGYLASDAVALELDEVGNWYEARLAVTVSPGARRMTTGKVIVRGSVGTASVRRSFPLRAGWGVLSFLENRKVQFRDGERAVDMACLEDRLLRAEFIPELGCLSGLFSHSVAVDWMVSGDLPAGLLWAGTRGWYHASQSGHGETAGLDLTTRHSGKRLAMRARMREGTGRLDIEFDASELNAPPGPIYIMTTRAEEGGDSVELPGKSARVAPQVEAIRATAGPAGTISVTSEALGETLHITYSAPSLAGISVGSTPPWYNHVALEMADECPGKVRLSLWTTPLPRE